MNAIVTAIMHVFGIQNNSFVQLQRQNLIAILLQARIANIYIYIYTYIYIYIH